MSLEMAAPLTNNAIIVLTATTVSSIRTKPVMPMNARSVVASLDKVLDVPLVYGLISYDGLKIKNLSASILIQQGTMGRHSALCISL